MARLRPSASQLSTGALVVTALALGQFLNDQLPDGVNGTDGARLFERHGAVDETIAMRSGDLTATSVDGASSILRDQGPGIRSPGVVLVVHFDYVPRQESTAITYARFEDGDGRITEFSNNGQRNVVTCLAGPVGIVSECSAVVEVDPDSLPGASLGLSLDALDNRFDDIAVIDLDIDAADVAGWRSVEELPVMVYRVAGR